MSHVGRVLAVLAMAYAGYAILLFAVQRWAMYPGARMTPVGPASSSPELVRIWLDVAAGGVEAWYVPAVKPRGEAPSVAGPAIILFHGNAEFIDDWPDVLGPLVGQGIPVLLVEYPGYGRSEGSPSQATILNAAAVGYDWIAARTEVDEDRIFGMGRSLGAAVAAGLSETRPLAGLILWSPFSSVGAIAWRSYGLPPMLVRDPFDSRRAVQRFEGPILIFHGRQDRVIPYRHATDLLSSSPRARLVSWECGHNDCPPSWPLLWTEIATFVADAR